ALELPMTTGIIFRSIANTARSFGEDLQDPNVRLECLQVFAMGSHQSHADDAMKSSYFSQRLAFYTFIKKVSEKGAASLLPRFIARVATEYEMVVAEKFLAESIPILGAVGGAAINSAFTHYFNQTAYYHFGLRYLERKHGLETIQKAYLAALKNHSAK
ncbi:MAG: EcsC family protein, partial [Pseudobdellovibrionaceae bacterium]